jgi:phage terminase small subunit
MALTDKHMKFVDEYMIDMNASAAYQRAGYTAKGNSAEANASRLLRNDKVQAEIAKRQQIMQEEAGMSVRWVLEQYRDLIVNNKVTEPSVAKGALDSVAKHYGMFTEKVKVEGTLSVEQLLREV